MLEMLAQIPAITKLIISLDKLNFVAFLQTKLVAAASLEVIWRANGQPVRYSALGAREVTSRIRMAQIEHALAKRQGK